MSSFTQTPVHRHSIAALVFTGALLGLASVAKAEEVTTDIPAFIKDCCMTPSYRQGDPRSLILTSPVSITLLNYIKDRDLTFHKPPLVFFQQVASLARVDFTINPALTDTTPFETLLIVTALPSLRSNLSDKDLENLHNRFDLLADTTFAKGLKGIDGALDEIYSKDAGLIVPIRLDPQKKKVSTCLTFTRPKQDSDIEIMIKRAFLQGFGYDADGIFINGSIFAEDGKDVTEKDESALRWLYDK